MSLGHWNLDVGGLVKQLQLKDATHRDAFFPMISARAATSQGLKHDYHMWFILIPFVSFWLDLERKLRTYEISYFFLMLLLQAYPVSCRVPEKTAPFRYQRIISEMRWYREIQWGICRKYPKIDSEYAFRKWSIVFLHLAGLVQTGSVSQGNGFLSWPSTEIPCSYQFVSGTVCISTRFDIWAYRTIWLKHTALHWHLTLTHGHSQDQDHASIYKPLSKYRL